jgi:hypothetical protein
MNGLARFAATAVALDVVHDVMDHVVQTDADAARKAAPAHWHGAMASHAGGQALAQGATLAVIEAATGRRAWARVLTGTVAVGVSHAFLDRRWPVVGLLRRTGSERFAAPVVRAHFPVDGYGQVSDRRAGVPHDVEATGALPLHGPYLADQALHRAVTLAVAAWLAR